MNLVAPIPKRTQRRPAADTISLAQRADGLDGPLIGGDVAAFLAAIPIALAELAAVRLGESSTAGLPGCSVRLGFSLRQGT